MAAALSFVFPGLGQAAAGNPRRGAIVAFPAVSVVATLGLIALFDRSKLLGLAVNGRFLTSLMLVNLVAFVYHLWAVVDAYLMAAKAQPGGLHMPASAQKWAATIGVFLIVGGTVGIHGEIQATGSSYQHTLYCLTAPTPCWITDAQGPSDTSAPSDPSGPPSDDPLDTSGPIPSGTLAPVASFNQAELPTYQPRVDSENWAQDGQLNVLLIGIGVEIDPSATGPDTVLAVHVDLKTKQSMMVSVGRTYTCVPLPTSWSHFATGVRGCPDHSYPSQLWNLENDVRGNCQNYPVLSDTCGQSPDPNKYLRATEVEEIAVGQLLGWPMDGSVTMNPVGLVKLIDDLGGIDIYATTTVTDTPCGPAGSAQAKIHGCVGSLHDGYQLPEFIMAWEGKANFVKQDPAHLQKAVTAANDTINRMKAGAAAPNANGRQSLWWTSVSGKQAVVGLTIKPGAQHMNGDWALAYARSRIIGNEFDRQGRQQDVLKALRKTVNPCELMGNLGGYLSALTDIPFAFNTDLPINNSADLQAWTSLASRVGGDTVQKIVLYPGATMGGLGGKVNIVPNNWTAQGYPMVDGTVINQIRQAQSKALNAPTANPSGGSGGGTTC
jgi:anionic cell wall polymer biosynthesis LytR-Cps2A-Psr (LCP) family protein